MLNVAHEKNFKSEATTTNATVTAWPKPTASDISGTM